MFGSVLDKVVSSAYIMNEKKLLALGKSLM